MAERDGEGSGGRTQGKRSNMTRQSSVAESGREVLGHVVVWQANASCVDPY